MGVVATHPHYWVQKSGHSAFAAPILTIVFFFIIVLVSPPNLQVITSTSNLLGNAVCICLSVLLLQRSLTCVSLSSVRMAVPPAYADLGKSAKDIFSKGFGKSLTIVFSFSSSTSDIRGHLACSVTLNVSSLFLL